MNINNINFTAFIRVAEAGSFNKAAESLYITSTALIKQINLLESELGLRLFNRSHRGLTLTKAGESLYKDAKYIIDYSRESVERAKAAMLEESQIIRIGTSPVMPAQMLMNLWPKIHDRCSDLNFRLVTFPVEWDHVMPVGILHSPEPSEVVQRFIAAAQRVLDEMQ